MAPIVAIASIMLVFSAGALLLGEWLASLLVGSSRGIRNNRRLDSAAHWYHHE